MTRYYALAILICTFALAAWADPAAEPDTKPAAVAKVAAAPSLTVTSRVKDIAHVLGARDNQLIGYGLVVGLNGTGDSAQSEMTALALANMLKRLNITVSASKLKAKNAAAVIVTAELQPFAHAGDRIDVTVSSLSDAGSLQGGTLLQTPLMGADGHVYAVAQGAVSLGGYSAGSKGNSKTTGHPTAGRIPNGALVEAEVATSVTAGDRVTLTLFNPDFGTAARVQEAINLKYAGAAAARDAATVDVRMPAAFRGNPVGLLAALGEVPVTVDCPARVVINERTGTVVIGGAVAVAPVALAQGNLTISVKAGLLVSQPNPFSDDGKTVAKPTAEVSAKEPQVNVSPLRGTTVDELVQALNGLRVSARDIIAILQALKQAGALQAEVVVL
jgi:flagellar P-ring protein precursor FlgI